jgi:hypothetical protein
MPRLDIHPADVALDLGARALAVWLAEPDAR